MEDFSDAMDGGWTVPYDGDIPPGFEDIAMVPSAPVEPMTGSAAERPTWGVAPQQAPDDRSIPASYAWPSGTDAVYRDMRLGADALAPEAPTSSNLLPLVLLALGAGGLVGWQYLGPLGAAGGALMGAAGVNAYRAFRSLKTNPQEAMTSGTWAVAGAAAAAYLLYQAGAFDEDEDEDEFDVDVPEGEDDDEYDERVARAAVPPMRTPEVEPVWRDLTGGPDDDQDDEPQYTRNAGSRAKARKKKPAAKRTTAKRTTAKPRARKPARSRVSAVRATPNAARNAVQMRTPTPVEPESEEGDA